MIHISKYVVHILITRIFNQFTRDVIRLEIVHYRIVNHNFIHTICILLTTLTKDIVCEHT